VFLKGALYALRKYKSESDKAAKEGKPSIEIKAALMQIKIVGMNDTIAAEVPKLVDAVIKSAEHTPPRKK
jgi:hypothetical protein